MLSITGKKVIMPMPEQDKWMYYFEGETMRHNCLIRPYKIKDRKMRCKWINKLINGLSDYLYLKSS